MRVGILVLKDGFMRFFLFPWEGRDGGGRRVVWDVG